MPNMKIRSDVIFNIIVVVYCLIVRHAEAFPFLFSSHNVERRQVIEWQQPIDEWNISSVPRSIIPFLKARNNTNFYLYPKTNETSRRDEEMLQRLREIKVKL